MFYLHTYGIFSSLRDKHLEGGASLDSSIKPQRSMETNCITNLNFQIEVIFIEFANDFSIFTLWWSHEYIKNLGIYYLIIQNQHFLSDYVHSMTLQISINPSYTKSTIVEIKCIDVPQFSQMRPFYFRIYLWIYSNQTMYLCICDPFNLYLLKLK